MANKFHAHVVVQVQNLTKTFPSVTILNTAFTLSVVESDFVLRVAGDSTFQSYDVIVNGPLGMFQNGNIAFSGYFTGYVKFGLNAVVANQLALNLFMPVRVTVPNMMGSSDVTLSVGLDFDISGLRTQVLVRLSFAVWCCRIRALCKPIAWVALLSTGGRDTAQLH